MLVQLTLPDFIRFTYLLTYLLSYLLTPYSRDLLVKLNDYQLVK